MIRANYSRTVDPMKHDPYLWQHKKTGYFYVVYYEGPLGGQKRRESLKTKDLSTGQDRLYLWKQQRAKEEALGIRHVGISLEDAAREYLTHFEKRYKPISARRYRNALDNILDFVNQDLPVASLQVKDLQDYQLHRIHKADHRTVDYEIDVMRAFLNWCRKRKWVLENVADQEHVDRLVKAESKKEKRSFTDDEVQVLLSQREGIYWQQYFIFNTLYYTGLRIGELSHLRVKDIGLSQLETRIQDKTLKVPVWNQAKKQIIVREVQWTPKWYEKRAVPIESRLEPILHEFQKQRTDNIFGLYFLSQRGCQVSDHISRQIKSLTGSQDVSVHTFRHTHISHALNRWGRHPSVVQKWVGHKNLKTTQQYIHVSMDDLHREAKKIGE